VVEFVPSDQIDPIMFDRSYFLGPDKTAGKAYAVLRRALEDTERTAIVQFSLRQKTRLGALRTRGKVLILQSLLWDDEVREADFSFLDEDVRVSAQELQMAGSLIDNMSTDFSPDRFSDDYAEQLRTLIAAKLEQGDAVDTAETFGEESDGESGGADVIDLIEALKQSVERQRSRRTGSDLSAAQAAKKSTAKKSTAKKATAKKATAKKATAKKATAKKATAKKTAKKAS